MSLQVSSYLEPAKDVQRIPCVVDFRAVVLSTAKLGRLVDWYVPQNELLRACNGRLDLYEGRWMTLRIFVAL